MDVYMNIRCVCYPRLEEISLDVAKKQVGYQQPVNASWSDVPALLAISTLALRCAASS